MADTPEQAAAQERLTVKEFFEGVASGTYGSC